MRRNPLSIIQLSNKLQTLFKRIFQLIATPLLLTLFIGFLLLTPMTCHVVVITPETLEQGVTDHD